MSAAQVRFPISNCCCTATCYSTFFSLIRLEYGTLAHRMRRPGSLVVSVQVWFVLNALSNRGEVEDTRLEAKAKNTKKIRGQEQPFRGQTLSRPRTGRPRTKDTSASALQRKKKVFTKIFQAISTKKRFPKNFSSAPQNFNNSKNAAILEPRTSQFSRT